MLDLQERIDDLVRDKEDLELRLLEAEAKLDRFIEELGLEDAEAFVLKVVEAKLAKLGPRLFEASA